MGDTDRLVRILLHGLQGPMEVRETRYNGVMPAFGQRLSDAEIAAVLTYVRTSWANGASDVTEADVREVRRQFPNRQQPWSASALRDDS
jgi:mono/diheme cytochrome c family protein